jgi:hypothetical protein
MGLFVNQSSCMKTDYKLKNGLWFESRMLDVFCLENFINLFTWVFAITATT